MKSLLTPNLDMPKIKVKKDKTVKKKKFLFQSPRGMHDVLPRDWVFWDRVFKVTKDVAEFYNFLKIETPILERSDLFRRTVGEESDIVSKEMFSLRATSDDLVMRPENTAGIARAYLQHGLSHVSQPLKLYYQGPFFRREQPQAGRFRQFHQVGFEILGGASDPIYDAQTILVFFRLMEYLKIKGLSIQVNSVGCRICRPHYRKKLVDYYRKHEKNLCVDCKRRLKSNPLRLLDCKDPSCVLLKAGAPSLLDNLCVSCNNHLKIALEYLDELSLPYVLNNYLVRGLDYYSRTVFEIFAEGSDLALAAGGRYDYLMEMIGGRQTPGVGGAMGVERVIELMKLKGAEPVQTSRIKVFFVYVGDLAKKKTLSLIEEFRKAGVSAQEALGKDSLKKQMQLADKAGAQFALIMGQKEVYEETAILRDLKTGLQEEVPLKSVVSKVKKG